MAEQPAPAADAVVLEMPASSAYLTLARAATASMCARLGFPVDRMEDVTLAVDEAISLLLLDAVATQPVVCRWTPGERGLVIQLSSTSSSGRTPRTTTFAWTVITALVTQATARIDGGRVTLTLAADRNALVTS